ncbi:hypothetical protein GBA52_011642 [Prunus armeniaca]|nr:hypothetical protein GBA52_011642 [Prunus armeniaca]
MRRRATDFRRPLRRRFPNALWWVLCGVAVLLFIFTLSRGNQMESRPVIPTLNDQIALAKAFVVIAKESNNLQFAWELSAQIRSSQILLSNAATRRIPLTIRESETAIRDMALILYQAQQLHYDSATMIMRLKAKIQALEEQMSSVSEKSSKYGQIAAEEVPKVSTVCSSKTLKLKVIIFLEIMMIGRTPIKFRNPKYLSMLNHLRFYIPEVFPALKEVVFLDDDVVVQKDVSDLFSIDLNGKKCRSNIVETCTLPPGLLTFYTDDRALDPLWHILGLGYTNVDPHLIEKGAVLHYNGNSKPWLKIGMEKVTSPFGRNMLIIAIPYYKDAISIDFRHRRFFSIMTELVRKGEM